MLVNPTLKLPTVFINFFLHCEMDQNDIKNLSHLPIQHSSIFLVLLKVKQNPSRAGGPCGSGVTLESPYRS